MLNEKAPAGKKYSSKSWNTIRRIERSTNNNCTSPEDHVNNARHTEKSRIWNLEKNRTKRIQSVHTFIISVLKARVFETNIQ